MPHAFAVVQCSCSESSNYHAFSHDDDEFLKEFKCEHFKSSALKKCRVGYLLGFDQLAGLYFNIMCLKCGKQHKEFYEAKTFGKEKKDSVFNCCGKCLNFHFDWAH